MVLPMCAGAQTATWTHSATWTAAGCGSQSGARAVPAPTPATAYGATSASSQTRGYGGQSPSVPIDGEVMGRCKPGK